MPYKGAIFLDRDGVINEDSPHSILSIDDFSFIKGSIAAIKALNDAHIQVIIVTNQSCVGKGLITQDTLDEIHDYMHGCLTKAGAHIDAMHICTDHPSSPTHRRKPNPGMLEEACTTYAPETIPLVGDALRDLEAAYTYGCPRHLVLTGKGAATATDSKLRSVLPVTVHKDLHSTVTYLLENHFHS